MGGYPSGSLRQLHTVRVHHAPSGLHCRTGPAQHRGMQSDGPPRHAPRFSTFPTWFIPGLSIRTPTDVHISWYLPPDDCPSRAGSSCPTKGVQPRGSNGGPARDEVVQGRIDPGLDGISVQNRSTTSPSNTDQPVVHTDNPWCTTDCSPSVGHGCPTPIDVLDQSGGVALVYQRRSTRSGPQ